MRRPRVSTRTGASLLVYGVLLGFALLEQVGKTTSDTKTPLIEDPAKFLLGATTLWDPSTDFGQLQNQAYGYLFPQGPFYLLGQAAHLPAWITERLWAVLVIVAAAEGARLVARSLSMPPWAAWVAGMAYGLSPRILSQVGVRSAEIVPTAALPWALLPLILACTGRLSPRRAALFSAVAFLFSGAVNATATVAGLPMLVIVIVWAARRRLVPWSMLGWWALVVAVTNLWWAVSLIRLRTYSPPFFDFVEDARTTTETTGYAATLRGLSNWINYTLLGNTPDWPAGWGYAFHPAMVLASGVLAAIGVVGLTFIPRPWRTPLTISAALGVVLLTVGHVSPVGSPLAEPVRHLLDGGFALLRNVSKADVLLRLPLCLGVGAVCARLAGARGLTRRHARTGALAVVVALVLGMAQPAIAMQLRSPGWTSVPRYWSQTADYLAHAPGQRRAWLVPGTGFALQTWGWTIDEPFQSVARTPWVTRSQIPLAPPQTIRILSQLEDYLESGSGSPNLGDALGRLGLGYIVVRHDLDEGASDTTTSNLVSIALARSRGVERVKTFGALDFGPAIEIYRVTSGVVPPLRATALSSVETVAGASSDVTNAVIDGVLPADRPAVVQGDDGWPEPAEIVGDSYRDRERNFGRVHDAEGPVLTPTEQRHGGRVVPDYPANEASKPVEASYAGGVVITASSSQAWTNGLGRVAPENAPFAAVDGDPSTDWRSGYYQPARRQWLQLTWPRDQATGLVTITSPVNDGRFADVTRWRVRLGNVSQVATVDPFTGRAQVDLTGARGRSLRVSVDRVSGNPELPVSIDEVASSLTPIRRSLVLPPLLLSPRPTFVFSAQPETRGCITTLLGPDCSLTRQARSEESTGVDRTFEVPSSGSWTLSGTVVARSDLATSNLLDPLGSDVVLHASSQFLNDPAVSVRMAYDGTTTTSWIADPRDPAPTLTVDFDRPRTIDRIAVGPPATPAVSPTTAVIRSSAGTRTVQLGVFGQFAPLTTRHLTITFANPTRGDSPLGVSELYLPPVRIAVPLDGAAVTGAVCGFGPVLHVDGRRFETSVTGFMGDVSSAGPLGFRSCSGPIPLSSGSHVFRLDSTSQFQPVTVLLRPEGATLPAVTTRSVGPATGPETDQRFTVGAGPSSMLATTRNVNAGWRATLDGRRLTPMISDGWAQAWRLPAGAGGHVVITYAPQTPYLVGLYAGLAIAAAFLLLALVLLLRTRLAPAVAPVAPPTHEPSSPSRWRRVLWVGGVVVALPISWLLGGVPAVLGVAVAVVVRRPVLLRWIAAALLVLAPVILASDLLSGPRLGSGVGDLLAGVGFTVVLASMVPALAGPRGRATG